MELEIEIRIGKGNGIRIPKFRIGIEIGIPKIRIGIGI
jgi:hypothetical protein